MSSDIKDYWQVQPPEKPLYDDLIWSQPQNTSHAGKLLIIGGNIHGFSAPAKAYELCSKAGIGSVVVALPDRLRPTLGKVLNDAVFCPSTPSGSFAKLGLAELLDHASWADACLLAGDLGRNSETAMIIEAFCSSYKDKLIITKDALDYFTSSPGLIVNRPNTLIVGTIAQLQKIAIKAYPDSPITFSMGLLKLIETLHQIDDKSEANFITMHQENLIAAIDGRLSSTRLPAEPTSWRIESASYASVWWLQNNDQPYEAITTAMSFLG